MFWNTPTHSHKQTYTHTHTCTHTHTHTQPHTDTHRHTDTHTDTQIHTTTHAFLRLPLCFVCICFCFACVHVLPSTYLLASPIWMLATVFLLVVIVATGMMICEAFRAPPRMVAASAGAGKHVVEYPTVLHPASGNDQAMQTLLHGGKITEDVQSSPETIGSSGNGSMETASGVVLLNRIYGQRFVPQTRVPGSDSSLRGGSQWVMWNNRVYGPGFEYTGSSDSDEDATYGRTPLGPGAAQVAGRPVVVEDTSEGYGALWQYNPRPQQQTSNGARAAGHFGGGMRTVVAGGAGERRGAAASRGTTVPGGLHRHYESLDDVAQEGN